MIMIRSIIRPEKADAVMAALMEAGFPAVTKINVVGRGKQRGIKIGDVTYDEIPKEMLITVVPEKDKDFVIKTVLDTARTGANGNYHIHMDGWSPTAIGTLPLGPVEVFAEAGYLFYNVNVTANYTAPGTETVESSHSRSDFLYGGGLGFTLFNHLNIRGEYQELNLSQYHNSNALWLSGAWRF